MPNGDHVFGRDEPHCVEDESVFLKNQKEHVFPTYQLYRSRDGRIGEDGRALLSQFDKQHVPRELDPPRHKPVAYQSTQQGQGGAEGNANNTVNNLELASVEFKSHLCRVFSDAGSRTRHRFPEDKMFHAFLSSHALSVAYSCRVPEIAWVLLSVSQAERNRLAICPR